MAARSNRIFPAFLLVALGAATPSAARADALAELEGAQEKLFEAVAPSVVFITAEGAIGSGFFVSGDGLVLTNAHVVGHAKTVDVVLHDGRRAVGEVVERGADDLDLALVQVPVKDSPPLVLDVPSDVRVGQFVASVGHGEGAIWTYNTGMISNIHPVGAEHPVLQTQIPLNPGNSGGPVVDRAGRVVGIVTAGITQSNSINFAIRSDVAVRALSRLAAKTDLLVITAPAGVPVFVDGAMAGQRPQVVLAPRAGPHEAFAVVAGKMRRRAFRYPAEKRVDLAAPETAGK